MYCTISYFCKMYTAYDNHTRLLFIILLLHNCVLYIVCNLLLRQESHMCACETLDAILDYI